jgi:hypothetical protein
MLDDVVAAHDGGAAGWLSFNARERWGQELRSK